MMLLDQLRVWTKILSIIMLLIAVFDFPYVFYMYLRYIVFSAAVLSIITAQLHMRRGWKFTYIVIAILFNPIIPVHLFKELWSLIDFATAIIIFFSVPELDIQTGKVAFAVDGLIGFVSEEASSLDSGGGCLLSIGALLLLWYVYFKVLFPLIEYFGLGEIILGPHGGY